MMTLGTVLREIQRQASQHPKNTVTLTLNEYAFLTDFINRPDIDLIDQKATAWDKLTEAVEANEANEANVANMELQKYDDPEQEHLEALDKLITEHLFEFVTFKKDGYTQSQQYRKFYGPKPPTT